MFRKPQFTDLIIYVMTACIAVYFDIILAEFFKVYCYINREKSLFYSTIYATFVYPAINYQYIAFITKWQWSKILYVLLWTVLLTIIEIVIIRPFGIIVYTGWEIIPWSPIIYILTFGWTSIFYEMLTSRLTNKQSRK